LGNSAVQKNCKSAQERTLAGSGFLPGKWLLGMPTKKTTKKELEQQIETLQLRLRELENITEQKQRAEEEKARLASFPILNPNPVIEADLNGNVLFMNPSAHMLFPDLQNRGRKHPFLAYWESLKNSCLKSKIPTQRDVPVIDCWYSQTIQYLEKSQKIRIYASDVTKRKRAEKQLEDSEHRYRQLVQSSPDAILVHRQGIILYANAAALSLYGAVSLGRLKEKNLLDLIHPDDRDASLARMRELEKGEKIPLREMRIARLDGQEVQVEAYGSRITYGEQKAIQVILRDITERKRAEQDLLNNQKILAEAQRIGNIGSWEWDIQSGKLVWSDQTYRIFGIEPGSVEPNFDFLMKQIYPEDYFGFKQMLENSLANGISYDGDFRLTWPDLSIRWIHSRGEFLCNASGQPVRMIGVSMDITKRKQTEDALRKSESRLAADLDAMTRLQRLGTLFASEDNLQPVLMEIIDSAIAISVADFGSIQLFDPKTQRFRIAVQRGFPQWWIDFWDGTPEGQGACDKALEQQERVIVEDVQTSPIFVGAPVLEIQLKAGVRALQSSPLLSRSGSLLGMLSTHYKTPHVPDERVLRFLDLLTRNAADIIERSRAEVALRQVNADLELRVRERTAELVERAAQLRALAGELTIVEQRERRRLANILHDHLQQLLVGAKFRLTALGRGEADPQKQALKQVEEVIDEAIASSRSLTAELSPPILHDEGLNAGFEWLVRRLAKTQGLFVELEAEEIGVLPDDLTILLFQSVRELLLNVVKHSQVRSARVTARRADGSLQVSVFDQGIGFDLEAMPPPGEAGRGFGLFSIRERLELFGGKIGIESAPGKGSRIVLSVPITVATSAAVRSAEAAASAEQPGRETIPVPVGSRKIRLLLADDHAIVRQGIANLLSDEPDMEIVGAAANGRETIGLVPKLLPDVILMDMNMPILNGVEATRIIHRDFPEIRIIGLSMFEETELARAMRDAGATNYLTKSGPAAELISAIRTAAGRSQKVPSANIDPDSNRPPGAIS
jgi:PAS domain S-box-containing protein